MNEWNATKTNKKTTHCWLRVLLIINVYWLVKSPWYQKSTHVFLDCLHRDHDEDNLLVRVHIMMRTTYLCLSTSWLWGQSTGVSTLWKWGQSTCVCPHNDKVNLLVCVHIMMRTIYLCPHDGDQHTHFHVSVWRTLCPCPHPPSHVPCPSWGSRWGCPWHCPRSRAQPTCPPRWSYTGPQIAPPAKPLNGPRGERPLMTWGQGSGVMRAHDQPVDQTHVLRLHLTKTHNHHFKTTNNTLWIKTLFFFFF